MKIIGFALGENPLNILKEDVDKVILRIVRFYMKNAEFMSDWENVRHFRNDVEELYYSIIDDEFILYMTTFSMSLTLKNM